LTDFVFPADLDQFNAELRSRLDAQNMPRLTGGDPTATDDGYYAIPDASRLEASDFNFIIGDDAWHRITDAVLETKAFSEPMPPLFVQCKLVNEAGRAVKPRGSNPQLALRPGSRYSLRCSYRCNDDASRLQAEVKVRSAEGLRITQPLAGFEVNSVRETCSITTAGKRFAEEPKGSFCLEADQLDVANANVPFALVDSGFFWLKTVGLLFVYGIAAALMVVLAYRGSNESIQHLVTRDWVVVLFVVVQTFALFFLVRMFGKRPI
jgi:hypothetical protein